MRVVVTGGTGFIGRGVVRELVARGHDVLQIVRASSSEIPDVRHLQANLSDPGSYAQALSAYEPEAAIHLAWEGIPDFSATRCEHNFTMSIRFIDTVMATGSCRKVIGAGSCWEYGLQEGICLENAPAAVTNDFTRAKDSIRRFGLGKAAETGKSFGWFRIFFVYGPGQRKGALIPSTVEAWRTNENAAPRNPGAAQDFIYLDDVVDALVRAVERDWPSGEYNLGTGSLTSVADIVRIVQELMNHPLTDVAPVERRETGGIWASTEQTRRHLQWQAGTPIGEGLRRTLAPEPRS
jgi:nucleoside-diphosphate-sugar epimerase